MTQRQSEAIVLRTWPLEEADLLVRPPTREAGRIKGGARHAMRSRRRSGGALEAMTHVRATYAEKPKQELVRLDGFEILWSPLADPVDYGSTAALAAIAEMQVGRMWMPVTYFALWMSRLMGWMPALSHCVACGLDLRGKKVWY